MLKNEGMVDRIVRIIVGLVAVFLGWKVHYGFYIVAAIAFITAATGFCGLYKLLGINTKKGGKND
jgi:hypothetical protein